jgi:hypothetical protein
MGNKAVMSKSILILTPDPDSPSNEGRWEDVLGAYVAALNDEAITISHQPWSAPVHKAYDLIVPLVAWGYHSAPDRFARALIDLMTAHVRNPANIVRWNMDKHYLRDLGEAGITTIPTIFVETVTTEAIARARDDFHSNTLVIKPVISAGSKNTVVHRGLDVPEGGPKGVAMIQPFMPAIQTEGEWSLIYLGGTLSHAVLKTPKSGDFRSQPEYEAHLRVLSPPEEAHVLAESVMDYLGRDRLLYARVDMVRADAGGFCLMEVELIEPDLYLSLTDGGAARFKAAVMAALL